MRTTEAQDSAQLAIDDARKQIADAKYLFHFLLSFFELSPVVFIVAFSNFNFTKYYFINFCCRVDLQDARDETRKAEEFSITSNESLSKLEDDMKNVRVQYLQISEYAKNAYEAADKAIQQAAVAEAAGEQLKVEFHFIFSNITS